MIDLVGRADLLHAAGVHDDHPLGERHRLDLIVRDEQRRGAQVAVQLLDLEARLRAQLGVEVGERLVEQVHGRLAHDGPTHGDALALAAGQFAGLPRQVRTELEDLGRLVDALLDLAHRHLRDLQAVRHVVEHGHVRIEA